MGELEQLGKVFVGSSKDLENLRLTEADTIRKHLGAGPLEDIWHARTLQTFHLGRAFGGE
ncbi:hypothetical protein GCM10010172_37700 [Paractinoplanes ferrugineus]|uniref:Uncharacterized protein n=1 Tax=Paractinoplanes ferrugineus TaxID=113564 RepID=A0A919IX00_9ACTN|nr:hypothetical protein Afe05nite_12070 [Actinoplanes ferrugineus]